MDSEEFSKLRFCRYRRSFIGNSEGAWNLCQLVAIDHRSEIAIPREQTELRTAKTVSPVSRTLHLLVFFYSRRLNAPELCVCCARETRSINGGNWRQKRKKIERGRRLPPGIGSRRRAGSVEILMNYENRSLFAKFTVESETWWIDILDVNICV